ncbi:MAG: branched-chain amino acid ABC transporter permease [Actinomycetales bacterium]|nr:branched-chain amino acid ABC transporter permease [Actinomycetales bacterium]
MRTRLRVVDDGPGLLAHRRDTRAGLLRRRWALRSLAGVGALLLGLGASVLPALAADTGLKGTVKDPVSGSGIAGVSITVTGADGTPQTVTTAADGTWLVQVPSAGKYEVTIDQTTLPDGLTLADQSKVTAKVNVLSEGRVQTVLFKLAAGTAGEGGTAPSADAPASKWSQIPQLTVDGLIFGIVIALAAVGLSLVFGTTKLTNFAHGELIALGGLSTYFFNGVVGLPLILSAALAVVVSAFVGGWVQNRYLWKPLRKRGTGLIAALVVSIGLGLFLRYFFLFIFGGQTRSFDAYAGQAGIEIGPVLITPKDLISSTIGILLIALTTFWLLKTQAGKATRAVADNPALASASGIDVEKVISTVWVLGAGLASFSGIMLGLQVGVSWQMGFTILLLVFAGSVLGGLGTAFGAILGSIIVGLLVQLSTLIIPTELKYVGALVVLIIILLIRPQGILGKAERIG